MLERHLYGPHHSRAPTLRVIQTAYVPTRNDLPQPPVLRVPHLDKVRVEQYDIRTIHRRTLRFTHKFHDNGPRDIAMLVDVHSALLVAEQELRVTEAEHAKRFLAGEAAGDGHDVWLLEIWDTPRLLLVESQDLKTPGSRDGEGRLEEIDAEAFRWDIKFIIFAEEFGVSLA
jgi:hypothetical protein